MASRKRWTNLELLTLGDLYRDGLSYNEIACKIGRSKSAVAQALSVYRDVIHIDYRSEGAGRKPNAPESLITPKKPWWKFW